MPLKHVVLTDVENETWIDSFSLTADDGLELAGAIGWSITKRTLRGGLSAGVDVVEVDNGAFAISILPTRGMGLWRGRFGDVPLGWNSPVKHPVNPSFVNRTDRNGLGWLTGFNELLCRCGLASHGAPGKDVVKDNNGNDIETELTLHGKIANTPAHYVDVQVSTDHGGTLSVTGIVDEASKPSPDQIKSRSPTKSPTSPVSRRNWNCCITRTSASRSWNLDPDSSPRYPASCRAIRTPQPTLVLSRPICRQPPGTLNNATSSTC